MSFSGTPLGQGRRLDHSSFLGKPTSNGSLPPSSYAYGAPALGSRSPPKPSSPSRTRDDDDENDPALLRFARLKQREAVQDHRPGAPKITTSPPKPEKWSVKDTSVNIATAFTQAANSDMSTTYNQNNSWASTSRSSIPIPRSTSVEYEASAPQTVNRRLAPPPDKLGRGTNPARKPPSKSTSLRHVPDSEGEEERPSANGRGKSPFEHGLTFAKQALGAAAYYVRQRSREPEDPSIEQPSLNGNHPTNGNDSSYDYAAEEQAFQAQKRNAAAIHKRNRMSVDNKAYKPTQSDDEESEYSDDGKPRRRRKLKKGPAGGPLSTLPVVTADKRKKKKGRGSKGGLPGADEEEESGSEDNTQTDIQSQMRASVPRSNQSHSRTLPPRHSQEPSYTDMDDSMQSADQGLHSIPEVEEELLTLEPVTRQASQRPRSSSRARSRTPAPQQQHSPFSIGGLLGKIVHVVIRLGLWIFSGVLSLLSMFTFLFGQVFGTTFDMLLRRPAGWARSAGSLFKYIIPALVLVVAWYTLQNASLGQYLPSISFPGSKSPGYGYQHPDVPPADIAELAERLLKIENAISALSQDTKQTKSKSEDGVRGYSDLLSRLGSLEGRLTTETKKVQDSEARARDAVSRSIDTVKSEVEILQSQLIAQQKQQQQNKVHRPTGDISDEEARARLKSLEERVGGVEGGVKEALELGKKAVTAPAAPAAGSGSAWWNKLASGVGSKTGLQIKTHDGQDVSGLISHLVDTAVSVAFYKDGVGKPDFALHSGGARVVPHLTSSTLEIHPQEFTSAALGLFTLGTMGGGPQVGRPPVTALHQEEHSGYCWPFKGQDGQLGVALAHPTLVEEVTIDHIPKEMAFDIRSAPRQMEVWGLVEGKDNVEKLKAWRAERAARKEAGEDLGTYDDDVVYPKTLPKQPEYIRLTNFSYDIHASHNVQTFAVDPEIKKLGIDFGIVALRVLNNWGHTFTCIYRFRVHGQRMGGVPEPWSEPQEAEGLASS